MVAIAYLNLVPIADYLAGEEASEMRHERLRPKPKPWSLPCPGRLSTDY
ncbi:MAG: hypothetical protein ACKODH_09905 [Limisphaerales bacterium]